MSHAALLPQQADVIREDFLAFCDHLGIKLYPWQQEAFGEATRREGGRFKYRVAGISVPRGNGKSLAGALVGEWGLIRKRGAHVLSAALGLDGARVVLDYARADFRNRRGIEVRANSILVPSTDGKWTVTSREHTSSRGEHPDIVVYDECGWARDDELFASLLAAQASVMDPLTVVISTMGKRRNSPLLTVKKLAEDGDPDVYWFYSQENLSPRITTEFLERQRRILHPLQYALEHENTLKDGADSLVSTAEVDDAMDGSWIETPSGEPGRSYVVAVDLGTVHDPSVIGVGHMEDSLVCIDRLVTFEGSRERPVQLLAVERAVRDLVASFPTSRVLIESWQGVALVQALRNSGLPAELFTPTATAVGAQWMTLSQLLTARALVLPPHPRLREELLGLSVEVKETGIKVTDRGPVHQDHAVVVRMIAAALVREFGRQPLTILW